MKFISSVAAFLGAYASLTHPVAAAVAEAPTLDAIRFELSVGQHTIYFDDCKGLGSESAVVETKTRGGTTASKVPGRLTVYHLTCVKNPSSSMELWNWRQLVVDGKLSQAQLDGTVIMYDETMSPLGEWVFTRGWPASIDVGQTNPGKETVVIAVEGIRRSR